MEEVLIKQELPCKCEAIMSMMVDKSKVAEYTEMSTKQLERKIAEHKCTNHAVTPKN